MKAVGIKVLKDNLSKYLKLVTSGEIIWVTDRDEIIAEIHKPTIPIPNKVTPWESFLNIHERNGSIKRAKSEKAPSLIDLTKLKRPAKKINLQELMDDVKSD